MKITRLLESMFILCLIACNSNVQQEKSESINNEVTQNGGVDPNESSNYESPTSISDPLVTHLYTADPSAHVFDDKIYIYPSHDWEAGVPADDLGSHFAMKDYHVFSMDHPNSEVVDHGVALTIEDIPWAKKQLWAPDAAYANGTYYLYFPAKDEQDIFRIGVAVSAEPYGPFVAEPNPIAGSFSIDPAVFHDEDGSHYLYFGGIWGGQLQRWRTGSYDPNGKEPADDEPALLPKMAKLSANMKSFAETPRDIDILDEKGELLKTGDHDRRFFEAPWVHVFQDKYYLSYSTGDTHFIAYALGDNPYGPFTFQGVILNPVIGWTNHHSIVEWEGEWYLFYHDSTLSQGQTHLRCMKMTRLTHSEDGKIETIEPYVK